jgi:hypothetical protein
MVPGCPDSARWAVPSHGVHSQAGGKGGLRCPLLVTAGPAPPCRDWPHPTPHTEPDRARRGQSLRTGLAA